MILRHPSKKALRAWLTGEVDSDLDDHLDSCQRCASTLESLDAEAEAPIADVLAAFFVPPADLSVRLEQKVTDRLDSKMMLNVVSDLFGAGFEATKLLLTEEQPDG